MQIDKQRRKFLAQAAWGGGALALAGFGLLPRMAAADDAVPKWPEAAFTSKKMDEAIAKLYGQKAVPSDKITLTAPDIAENGAVVPVSVETTLPNVTRISFVVPDNPFPLAANFVIPAGTEPYISNRLKMGKTSSLIALVESDGKLYSATKQVKVTVGGCGG